MITHIVPEWLYNGVRRCITRECPITLTYTKEDGTVTVRTVEPYAMEVSNAGDPLLRTLDRESHKPRTFRMDRITAYTVHVRGRWLLDHSPTSGVLTAQEARNAAARR